MPTMPAGSIRIMAIVGIARLAASAAMAAEPTPTDHAGLTAGQGFP